MSKIITDEQELNTATGELVTEDYALEILGLQSIADFRKFSRSFMKLSKIVKGIENSNNNKLDKGAVSSEYDTAKKIEDKIENLIKTKEPSITKKTAFNKDFGTSEDKVLEGAKLAETLGIPYGGSLNNSNTKTEGTAYYDSTTKKTYKCTVTNTLNYADASKYEAISNNDLLLKFQNLSKYVEENLYFNDLGYQIKNGGNYIFTLKTITNFKMIHFVIGYSNSLTSPNPITILVSDLDRKLDIYQGGDSDSSVQRRLYLEKISDTEIKLTTYDAVVKVFKIVGIKF